MYLISASKIDHHHIEKSHRSTIVDGYCTWVDFQASSWKIGFVLNHASLDVSRREMDHHHVFLRTKARRANANHTIHHIKVEVNTKDTWDSGRAIKRSNLCLWHDIEPTIRVRVSPSLNVFYLCSDPCSMQNADTDTPQH